MLHLNLQRVCRSRGIDKPSHYLQAHGISLTTANRALKGEYENFSMLTIERFCLILHCTPNDLLEWIPSKDDATLASEQPIHSLKREDKVHDVTQLINSIPLEKLNQMEDIIRRELGL